MGEPLDVERTVRAFDKILDIAHKYSFLWQSGNPLYGKTLEFSRGFIAADESCSVGVDMFNRKFYFSGKELGDRLTSNEAVERISQWPFIGYPLPEVYIGDFVSNLRRPLGKCLSEKELKNLDLSF